MLLRTITVLLVLMEKTNGGYIYPRPNISFKLPNIESNLQEDIQQKTINQFLPQSITETVVSYSVPLQNYRELNEHNSNLLSDEIQESKAIGDLTVPSVAKQQNNLEIIQLPQYKNPAISIPSLKLIAPHSYLNINTGQHINIPVADIPINQNNDYATKVNVPTIPAVTVLKPIKEQSNFEVNTVQHFDISADGVSNVDLHAQTKLYSNDMQYIDIPQLNTPTVNGPASGNLRSNSELTTQQPIIQQDNNNDLNSPVNSQNFIYPNIMKHIYFHVPPPEIEEPSVRTVIPKIKNVNIVFIKVPSQQRKDIDQSERNAINQVAPIEEKIIIYVLSKISTSEQVHLPKPVTPHEVFFVKYNGSADSVVTQISDNLEQIENR